jgi:hypothetical protein
LRASPLTSCSAGWFSNVADLLWEKNIVLRLKNSTDFDR